MAQVAQQSIYYLKKIFYIFVFTLIALIVTLAVMFSTSAGSKFLLDRVMENQNIVEYKYKKGNLYQGIELEDVLVRVENVVEVKVTEPILKFGWQAIFSRTVHLKEAKVNNITIKMLGQSSNKPFTYPNIALPLDLRVDVLDAQKLEIITRNGVSTVFNQPHLKRVVWQGTQLNFDNIRMSMFNEGLRLDRAKGYIDFDQQKKYKIELDGDLNIATLDRNFNIQKIKINAGGSLDEIKASVSSKIKQAHQADARFDGSLTLNPLHDRVPMKASLKILTYQWPFIDTQKLWTEEGDVQINGNIDRLNIDLSTSLSGEDLPEATYRASMHTDFVTSLHVTNLNTNLLESDSQINGSLNWEKGIEWKVDGVVKHLKLEHPKLPDIVRDFLPPKLNGEIKSHGTWREDLNADVSFDLDGLETWSVKATQKAATPQKNYPLLLNVKWQDINRALPYIGKVKSPSGQIDFAFTDQKQDIRIAAQVLPNDSSVIPSGTYEALFNIDDHVVNLPRFSIQDAGGSLTGRAKVNLATPKNPLTWEAEIRTKQFNLARAMPDIPFVDLNGSIKLAGLQKANQHVIRVPMTDLIARMVERREQLVLKGTGAVVLYAQPEKLGNQLKSFAVDYTGLFDLKESAIQDTQANLRVKVSGTPKYLMIEQFDFNSKQIGAARIKGNAFLKDQIHWKLDANLNQIKPEYFYKEMSGNVSGRLLTEGVWSNTQRRINVDILQALTGTLNRKPVNLSGQLDIAFDPKRQQLLPQRFTARNFVVKYAENEFAATGHQDILDLKLAIRDLKQLAGLPWIPSDISGSASGNARLKFGQEIAVQTDNLRVENLNIGKALHIKAADVKGKIDSTLSDNASVDARIFGFKMDDLSFKSAHVLGDIPTSLESRKNAKLGVQIAELKINDFSFEKFNGQLLGTAKQHQLDLWIYDRKKRENHRVSLTNGNLNKNRVWKGCIRGAIFQRDKIKLIHQANTTAFTSSQTQCKESETQYIYDFKNTQVDLKPHSWVFKNSDQNKGSVSLDQGFLYNTKEIRTEITFNEFNISPLSAFVPYNVLLNGQLDGRVSILKKRNQPLLVNTPDNNGLKSENISIQLSDANKINEIRDNNSILYFNHSEILLKNRNGLTSVDFRSFLDTSKHPKEKPENVNVKATLTFNPETLAGGKSPLSGEFVLKAIPLEILKLFVSDVKKLEGTASFKAGITGTIASPLFKDGELVVKDGQIEMASMPINLNNVKMYAVLNQRSVKMTGSFESRFGRQPNTHGFGTIAALGQWSGNDFKVDMRLGGRNLGIDGSPLFKAVIDPEVLLSVNYKKQQMNVKISGNTYIPWAQVNMPETNLDAIEISQDSVLKRSILYAKDAKPLKITGDLDVILARTRDKPNTNTYGVYFNAFENNIPLHGKLKLTQDSSTFAKGVIELNPKTVSEIPVSVLGQDMNIKRARLDFSGLMSNPRLDIEVGKKIQGAEMGIKISEALAMPTIQFVNDEGLSEQETLNAIVTGRIRDGSSSSAQTERFKNNMNNSLTAAGLSLGLGSTRKFTNQIGKGLGLKALSLNAEGTADDTQVSITGYLSPELYIRYGIGVFTPVNKLTIRYQANKRLYVEASQSIERALDVFYNWKY